MEIDFEICLKTFAKRYAENVKNKDFDNSRLPAGSPMYYYCHGCFVLVDTRGESWWGSPPPTYYEACYVLAQHGLLEEAQKHVQAKMDESSPKKLEGPQQPVCECCKGKHTGPPCLVCGE